MVFCACSVLNMLRIVLLEKPLFKWIGDHKEAIEQDFKKNGQEDWLYLLTITCNLKLLQSI